MLKLRNRKGNTSTIRTVRNEKNEYCGLLGTLKDLKEENIIEGTHDNKSVDFNTWLLIEPNSKYPRKFSSKEEIKEYLGIE